MNPARSFGPAVISGIWTSNHWIYWIAPLCAALFVGVVYKAIFFKPCKRNNILGNQRRDSGYTHTDGGDGQTNKMHQSQHKTNVDLENPSQKGCDFGTTGTDPSYASPDDAQGHH